MDCGCPPKFSIVTVTSSEAVKLRPVLGESIDVTPTSFANKFLTSIVKESLFSFSSVSKFVEATNVYVCPIVPRLAFVANVKSTELVPGIVPVKVSVTTVPPSTE